MRILVCISNVPDTTTKVKFSNDNTSIDENGVQWIINPWDELALTRAMEIEGGCIQCGFKCDCGYRRRPPGLNPPSERHWPLEPMMPSGWMQVPVMPIMWPHSLPQL